MRKLRRQIEPQEFVLMTFLRQGLLFCTPMTFTLSLDTVLLTLGVQQSCALLTRTWRLDMKVRGGVSEGVAPGVDE